MTAQEEEVKETENDNVETIMWLPYPKLSHRVPAVQNPMPRFPPSQGH